MDKAEKTLDTYGRLFPEFDWQTQRDVVGKKIMLVGFLNGRYSLVSGDEVDPYWFIFIAGKLKSEVSYTHNVKEE